MPRFEANDYRTAVFDPSRAAAVVRNWRGTDGVFDQHVTDINLWLFKENDGDFDDDGDECFGVAVVRFRMGDAMRTVCTKEMEDG